ncbi:siderophore-interacting protein [Pseudoclavibacter chungangensis]|uniref:Siderophore-interacting protein n=1 Tax=Pseudoclavibacter chungangensis TaxID=587635 RepID=A0A7J5BZV7_9MICO|nr:SIP domain-containing protein [Pseudoclavibacter chungangensis]KAB1660066.1 siderophore-interacting protein [Pseudoclavibacter chungangensis]NYJ66836.1 NADPH-dependent ferric siderophore reductase [Pseudoclavibacter chungangensis]
MPPLICLFIGDQSDLPQIRRLCDELPTDSYGQIFIEVTTRLQVVRWSPPAGMTLTWLCRDESRGRGGAVAKRGELATRALRAWAAEWLPEDGTATDGPYSMWVGCSSSPLVTFEYHELRERLACEPEHFRGARPGSHDG